MQPSRLVRAGIDNQVGLPCSMAPDLGGLYNVRRATSPCGVHKYAEKRRAIASERKDRKQTTNENHDCFSEQFHQRERTNPATAHTRSHPHTRSPQT